MKEIWKDIVGYEDSYQISNRGRLRTKTRMSKEYFSMPGKRHIVKSVLRKPSVKNGYYFLWLYNKEGKKMQYIHRLVAEHFLKGSGKCVDHIDRNRLNNEVSNLRWASYSLNGHNGSYRKNKVSVGVQLYHGKYKARIRVNNVTYHLGTYATKEEATSVYILHKQKVIARLY